MMAVVSRISQLICWNPKQFPRLGKSRLFLAPGPLQIPPGVMKAGGEFLSYQLAVLFTKTKAQCREPLIVLMWKGGMLVPLWKGKSSPTQPEAYRSIFISNYTAKIYHQCLRTHLVNTWEASLSHLQCGGRPGIGADIAHHVVPPRSCFSISILHSATPDPDKPALQQCSLCQSHAPAWVVWGRDRTHGDHSWARSRNWWPFPALAAHPPRHDAMQQKMVLKPPARLLIMVNDQGELLMIWSMWPWRMMI